MLNDGRAVRPLRLMVYDATCRGAGLWPGLTDSWRWGGLLYRALGRFDAYFGTESWADGLCWLASFGTDRQIAEIQFWGHGKWGCALVAGEALDRSALRTGHRFEPALRAVRERLAGSGALWWFRTCETFGATAGQDFARSWVDYFGCQAAGHTFIIGPWQSGLHRLRPGQRVRWDGGEGLLRGTPEAPQRARWSSPFAPNTITCLHTTLPRHV